MQTEELKAHLPMSLHPSPESILVIGGSQAVLIELLKYPASKLDFVEIDPEMVRVSLGLLKPEDRDILTDKRVRMITTDARRFIKTSPTKGYDLIISNLPEPATANINRFYTTDFFREASQALRKNGVLALTLPTSAGYISRKIQTANGAVYNSLRQVFGYTALSSPEFGFFLGSNSPIISDPGKLSERFTGRRIRTGYFIPDILDDAFAPLKVKMVKERLEKVTSSNSDKRPVAYLYNLMVWAEMHGGRLLNTLLEAKVRYIAAAVFAAFLALAAAFRKKNEAAAFSVFTTGYSTMAFSLVIILAYQATYGYVYEMIGLLTAVFMAGMAAGARMAGGAANQLQRLKYLEAGAIALFLAAAFFLRSEFLFYLLNFLCGMTAGMQFVTAVQQVGGGRTPVAAQEQASIAGKLYGLDLAGSLLGALLASVLLVPLLGLQNMILSLLFLKGISLVLLFSVKDEKN